MTKPDPPDVCELHEVFGCTVCSGKDRTMERATIPDGIPFAAAYDGHCDECNLPIVTGTQIVRRHYWGGRSAYIHKHCSS